jgi:hypothetical protein
VAFSPTFAGSSTGTLTLVSNATTSPTGVGLSGTGTAVTFLLSSNPPAVNFGNVNVGSSISQSVIISNSGNSKVTITQVTASGAGFAVSGLASAVTLTPGQNASLNLTFTPTAAGSATGSASVSSTATGSPLVIQLSGGGIIASHSATLSWTPSSSAVVGYNVYRGLTPGGPYSTEVAKLLTASNFVDTTVQAGTTYYYVVTAVDSSGNESIDSNEAIAAVP